MTSPEMVHVENLGWIRLNRKSSHMEFYRSVPRETLLRCTLQVCGVAGCRRDDAKNPTYLRREVNGWWLESIKDNADGHQFAMRNKFSSGTRVRGSSCIAHRATGLIVAQPEHTASFLQFFGAVCRGMLQSELSLEDFCLLRLLQRLQKVHDQMRTATSLEAAESVRSLGLDPQQTVEQWMGAAYERAGSALVRLKLS